MSTNNRYGRIKGAAGVREFSIYEFGVIHTDETKQTTEIDARFVTPTGGNPEAQISVRVMDVYDSGRCVAKIGGMVLKPEDAEKLAVRIAPKFGEVESVLTDLNSILNCAQEHYAKESALWARVRSLAQSAITKLEGR